MRARVSIRRPSAIPRRRAAAVGVAISSTAIVASSVFACSAAIEGPSASILGPHGGPSPSPSASPSPSPSPTAPPATCANVDPATLDPGRVTLRRLNRAEYDNTVRDLLGDTSRPARAFPEDDHGYGFDNIGDVLAVSPLLFEKWFDAAEALAARTLAPTFRGASTTRFGMDQLAGPGAESGDFWNLYVSGEVSATFTVAVAGEYEITTVVGCQLAGPEPCRAELRAAGRALQAFDVATPLAQPVTRRARVRLAAGPQQLGVAFTNDYYDAATSADRNLLVRTLEVRGPLDVAPSGSMKRAEIMTCEPADDAPLAEKQTCARTVLGAFGLQAWRRPLEAAELDRLVALAGVAWSEGDAFFVGITLALDALLLSPNFTFRVEADTPAGGAPRALGGYELASRLSYFLWSSTPDAPLLAAAAAGELDDPTVVASQVRRMLADPRARALTENFAGQWLMTRALDEVRPDAQRFAGWDAALGQSMRRETESFFTSFVVRDRSMLELLDTQRTFVNDRLAAHYGLPAVGTATVVETVLPPGLRRGLLGHGSILTVTSHARRTSPVKRGKWVLEQLLCDEPAPPPPGISPVGEEVVPSASLRERLEQHATNPVCAGCHLKMDPIGFGLERFDAIGALRERDEGFPIDATGRLPSGATFDGPVELASLVKSDPRFPGCISEKLLTYALGRGLGARDTCQVEAVADRFAAGGYSFRALATAIATSRAFTHRAAEAP
jgi:hypothetical protein